MKHHFKHSLAGCCAMGLCGPAAAEAVRSEARRKQQAKLTKMANRATTTGKKVRGYNGKQLRAMALFMS